MNKKQLMVAWCILITLGSVISLVFSQDTITKKIYIPTEEELTDEYIKALYMEFKNTIISPANPDTIEKIKDYKIENIEKYIVNISELYWKISALYLQTSHSDASIKKYSRASQNGA